MSGWPGLVIGECLGVLQPGVSRGLVGALLLCRLLLSIDWRWVCLSAAGRRRRERIEPVPGGTSAQPHFRFLVDLFVIVNLLSQLAEDVIDLIVDGEMTAPQLRPDLLLHVAPASPGPVPLMAGESLVCFRLSAGGQAIIELPNNSVEKVQTTSDVITEMKDKLEQS